MGRGKGTAHFAVMCVWEGGEEGKEEKAEGVLEGLVKKNLIPKQLCPPCDPICHPTVHPASSPPLSNEKITKNLKHDLEKSANYGNKNYSDRTHLSKELLCACPVLMP